MLFNWPVQHLRITFSYHVTFAGYIFGFLLLNDCPNKPVVAAFIVALADETDFHQTSSAKTGIYRTLRKRTSVKCFTSVRHQHPSKSGLNQVTADWRRPEMQYPYVKGP